MWVKLGNMKPAVEAPQYAPLNEEQMQQTREIAELVQNLCIQEKSSQEQGFAFIDKFHEPVGEIECSLIKIGDMANLRMVYPYFALYGDVLIDEEIDPLPERILKEYADA